MSGISVCVTCYNEAPFIQEALESVLNQTRGHEVKEIVVVNDGSTDESDAKIRQIADLEPRIHYIHQENAGLPSARNAAMKCATGEFIAFLDGDDSWAPNKLEIQMQGFSDPSVGLVYSDYVDFASGLPRDSGMLVSVRRHHAIGIALAMDFFLYDGPIIPSTVIIRRAVYESIGGFDQAYPMGEDTDYWMRVALGRYRFYHVGGGLTYKRRHGASITADLERLLPVFEDQTEFYSRNYAFLRSVAARRLSWRYAKVAQSLMANGRTAHALPYLCKSIRKHVLNHRAFVYLLLAPVYASVGRRFVDSGKHAFHIVRSRIRTS